jgi:hypothetical protein
MLYQLSYPRIRTRFYRAQDLPAVGIYKDKPTGGATSALWGTAAAKKSGGVPLGQR